MNQLRDQFLEYFRALAHEVVKSSSLIPFSDPSLMFTNAGMVQFKDIFTGKKKAAYKRAVTSQKCLRAGGKHNDLDMVGYTARHHTFFEMLGNFSFGDYFKEMAIEYGWKFVTSHLGLPQDQLLVTVHASDEEAAAIWKRVASLPDSRIIRIPTSDNFWSMGETGPCGPCTEMFYDHGEEIPGGIPGSADEDGDRFVEIWNLVFMQFETLAEGERIALPKPSIDTGMGLERISAVLQGVHNNFDIDVFKTITTRIMEVCGRDDPEFTVHRNVIADHMRAICFMISDGMLPSNEGRGYVLRRIIRRAIRHGYMMGIREPFLHRIIETVKDVMGSHYTELIENESVIVNTLKLEESLFMKTIDNGMSILKSELNKLGSSESLNPEIAYKLYDTFGFPFDLTQDILRAEGKSVDEPEFEAIVAKNREISKRAWSGTGDSSTSKVWYDIASQVGEVNFLRNTRRYDTEVIAIVNSGNICGATNEGDAIEIVTRETPFYAESGGQAGDRGWIMRDNTVIAEVLDTKKIAGIASHICHLTNGKIETGEKLFFVIDWGHRLRTSRNHTATHILHGVLRRILGEHVTQKGSSVTSDRLRFDFIHHEPVSHEQLIQIESEVNAVIAEDLAIQTDTMTIDDAKSRGALALFGEKYPDIVRVVSMGARDSGGFFSMELCGGEHVGRTSQIGCFKIISTSSVGAGVRRIEAVTGQGLASYLDGIIREQSQTLVSQSSIIKDLKKRLEDYEMKSTVGDIEIITEDLPNSLIFRHVLLQDSSQKAIFALIDREKGMDGKRCLLIGNDVTKSGKMTVIVYVAKECSNLWDARDALKCITKSLGLDAKISGRPDLAQLGGLLTKSDFQSCLQYVREYSCIYTRAI
jgi:alanyl-tRNA synthetase